MACGEMTPSEFEAFLKVSLGHAAAHSEAGALHYVCMHWSKMKEMLAAADGVYDDLINLCVWNKTNAGMGSLYRSKHELIFIYRKGKGGHVNNVALGRFGRHRSNVWDYPGQNIFNGTAKSKKATSDRQAGRAGRRRHPGRVASRRDHSGPFRRRGFDVDCG